MVNRKVFINKDVSKAVMPNLNEKKYLKDGIGGNRLESKRDIFNQLDPKQLLILKHSDL